MRFSLESGIWNLEFGIDVEEKTRWRILYLKDHALR